MEMEEIGGSSTEASSISSGPDNGKKKILNVNNSNHRPRRDHSSNRTPGFSSKVQQHRHVCNGYLAKGSRTRSGHARSMIATQVLSPNGFGGTIKKISNEVYGRRSRFYSEPFEQDSIRLVKKSRFYKNKKWKRALNYAIGIGFVIAVFTGVIMAVGYIQSEKQRLFTETRSTLQHQRLTNSHLKKSLIVPPSQTTTEFPTATTTMTSTPSPNIDQTTTMLENGVEDSVEELEIIEIPPGVLSRNLKDSSGISKGNNYSGIGVGNEVGINGLFYPNNGFNTNGNNNKNNNNEDSNTSEVKVLPPGNFFIKTQNEQLNQNNGNLGFSFPILPNLSNTQNTTSNSANELIGDFTSHSQLNHPLQQIQLQGTESQNTPQKSGYDGVHFMTHKYPETSTEIPRAIEQDKMYTPKPGSIAHYPDKPNLVGLGKYRINFKDQNSAQNSNHESTSTVASPPLNSIDFSKLNYSDLKFDIPKLAELPFDASQYTTTTLAPPPYVPQHQNHQHQQQNHINHLNLNLNPNPNHNTQTHTDPTQDFSQLLLLLSDSAKNDIHQKNKNTFDLNNAVSGLGTGNSNSYSAINGRHTAFDIASLASSIAKNVVHLKNMESGFSSGESGEYDHDVVDDDNGEDREISHRTISKRTSFDPYSFQSFLQQHTGGITGVMGSPTPLGASLGFGYGGGGGSPPAVQPYSDFSTPSVTSYTPFSVQQHNFQIPSESQNIPTGIIPLDLSRSYPQVGSFLGTPYPSQSHQTQQNTFDNSQYNQYSASSSFNPYLIGGNSYGIGDNFGAPTSQSYGNPYGNFGQQSSGGGQEYNTITGGIHLLSLLNGQIPEHFSAGGGDQYGSGSSHSPTYSSPSSPSQPFSLGYFGNSGGGGYNGNSYLQQRSPTYTKDLNSNKNLEDQSTSFSNTIQNTNIRNSILPLPPGIKLKMSTDSTPKSAGNFPTLKINVKATTGLDTSTKTSSPGEIIASPTPQTSKFSRKLVLKTRRVVKDVKNNYDKPLARDRARGLRSGYYY